MKTFGLILVGILASRVAGKIFKFPLANGFPNVTMGSQAFKNIEHQAGGPLPSTGKPLKQFPSTAYPALQAVAFNEIFEVAFFSQLLQNVTQIEPGFELGNDRDLIIAALNSSQAANMGLNQSGNTLVEPCEYRFPVSNFQEALAVADDFTGLLIGAVQALTTDFGDQPEIVTLYDSILGQEGQQDGYFRWLMSKIPNQAPYLTATQLSFIYNHIVQNFVMPGTCSQKFNLPSFTKLWALETPPAKNTTISFRTTQPNVTDNYHVAYMSGQLTPKVVSISKIVKQGAETEFQAAFPFDSGFSRGLTVAALVKNGGQFANVMDVSDATLAGPALINVYYE